MANQVGTPNYRLATEAVIKAKTAITGKYDIPIAIRELKKAYGFAEEMIKNAAFGARKETDVPLAVALELMDFLTMDKTQFEDELKYHAAKACRVFVDLTFYFSHKRNIFPETHKKLLEDILKVRETLPKMAIGTAYELKCVWATSLVLNDEKMYLKQFAINNFQDIASAIASLSPSGLAKPLLNVGRDLYRLMKTSWFNSVYTLHLWGKTHLLDPKFDPSTGMESYFKELSKHIPKYRETKAVATCVFNTLSDALGKSKDEKGQLALLKGENVQTHPGIKDFVNLGLDKKLNNWWKLRYQVAEKLFDLVKDKDIKQHVWQCAIDSLYNKSQIEDKTKKENKEVTLLFQKHLEDLKEQEAIKGFEHLQERVKYLRDKAKEHADKIDQDIKAKKGQLKQKAAELKQAEIAEDESSDEEQKKSFGEEPSVKVSPQTLQSQIDDLESELGHLSVLKAFANL